MAGVAGVRVLVFRVADLLCGAEATAVREILPQQDAVRMPGAPDAVSGMINVRGQLVTLVDGRRALAQPPAGDRGSIVVMRVGEHTVGVTVDEVIDLFGVSAGDLSNREELPGVDPRLVRAVGRHSNMSFALLDLDVLLGSYFSS